MVMSLYSRIPPSIVLALGAVLALGVMPAGCASLRAPHPAASLDADGVFVRHVRLRLAPADTKGFEAVMKRCVEIASAANLPDDHEWLCYRESPGRYWILTFSDSATGFATPRGLPGFVEHIAAFGGDSCRRELRSMLADIEYETEWIVVLQQKASWSTVAEMTTATHPKARIVDRTIRPGMAAAFDEALAARTAFMATQGYPLPIEGFVVRSGAPGRAMQVLFPVDWSSFHAADSFYAFSLQLPPAAQEAYAAHKAALLPTMSRAEYHDASFVAELSYGS